MDFEQSLNINSFQNKKNTYLLFLGFQQICEVKAWKFKKKKLDHPSVHWVNMDVREGGSWRRKDMQGVKLAGFS